MDIAALRAKALTYAPELPYPIVLDRDIKHRVSEAQKSLATAQSERDRILSLPHEHRDQGQTLADLSPTVRADERIRQAEADLDAAMDAARPESLVLIFKRLPPSGPSSYEELLVAHTHAATGDLDVRVFGDALLSASYLRTESADGEDVGMSLAEAMLPLDHMDLENLRMQVIAHNRVGASVSFDPRSSGRPATS